jgi:hypothetical protein
VSTAVEVASAGEVVDQLAEDRFCRRLAWALVVVEIVWLCAVGYGISLLFG